MLAVTGLATMIAGTIVLLVGELAISIVNNLSAPPTTLVALAAVELCFVGAIFLGLGYAGLTRNLSSDRAGLQTLTQVLGFLLGVGLVAGILFSEAIFPAPYGLTVYGMTAALVAGLTVLCIVMNSFMRPESDESHTPRPTDYKGFV